MFVFLLILIAVNLAILFWPSQGGLVGRLFAIYNVLDFGEYARLLNGGNAAPAIKILISFVEDTDYSRPAVLSTAVMLTGLALLAFFYNRSKTKRLDVLINQAVVPGAVINITLIICYFCAFLIVLITGPEKFFSYSDYGSIKAGAVVGDSYGVLKTVGSLFRFAVLLLCALFFPYLKKGGPYFILSAGPAILLGVAIAVAEVSRVSTLYFIVLAFGALVSRRRISAVALMGAAFVLVMYSLEARGHSQLGLAYAQTYAVEAFSNPDAFLDGITNITARSIIVSAAATIASPDEYSTAYKIISFSPFPNFIDNFDILKSAYEQRIHTWVPFSAYSEAYLFGPVYFVLFWSILAYCVACVNKSIDRGPVVFIISFGLLLLALSAAAQYPIRNCERYFYIVIVFNYLINRRSDVSNLGVGRKRGAGGVMAARKIRQRGRGFLATPRREGPANGR
jgi:hypothetical protein